MISLDKIAIETMIEKGFIPSFPPEVLSGLSQIKNAALPRKTPLLRDLRDWPWISIDNDDTKDIDQLTFAKGNTFYCAIADVDAIVKKDSPIDRQAGWNTTSVYTPSLVFPMLPLELSNDLTSLNQNANRCAIVIEMEIGNSGEFTLVDIYPAWVRNQGKLTYNEVGAFLETKKSTAKIANHQNQLLLQDEIARKIQIFREEQGALEFGEIQVRPIIESGVPIRIEEARHNLAHKLIENFMIAANVCVTHYLNKNNKATLRRVVRTPKRWDRIVALSRNLGTRLPSQPDGKSLRSFLLQQQKRNPSTFPDLSLAVIKLLGRGEYVLGNPNQAHLEHFDLAEMEYAHTTAPNRRYPDLVMQRLLKDSLYLEPPAYTNKELAAIAAHCTKKEADAAKVERRMIKCAAAMVMKKDIGKTFKAMVTGASSSGTWVRITNPPIEGKLTQGFEGLDVGHYTHVKLVHVDIYHGHIDFHRVF